MKANFGERRKSIKVWVSDLERALLEEKANYYGYKKISKYVRDATIYEKVTHIELKNKTEIYNAYAENTKELKKITKQIRNITKFATQLNDITIKNLTSLMFTIINNQKKLLKLIDSKLDLEIWQEINHNKNIVEE